MVLFKNDAARQRSNPTTCRPSFMEGFFVRCESGPVVSGNRGGRIRGKRLDNWANRKRIIVRFAEDVHDAAIAIGGLLDILRNCDLPITCSVALRLWNSRGHYGRGSRLLSEQSKLGFSKKMIPIRRALAAETRNFETRPNCNCLECRRNKSCSK